MLGKEGKSNGQRIQETGGEMDGQTDRRMSSAREVFVFVLLKKHTHMNAMQIGTWQLWSPYEELRI